MLTSALDFHLPPELIAQEPAPDRAASRLLHHVRAADTVTHRTFHDLPGLLRTGDLLVFNNARVIPARFTLRKSTGGRVEGLFLSEPAAGTWRVLLRNAGRARAPMSFEHDRRVEARIAVAFSDGEYEIAISSTEPAMQLLDRVGRMPLPPYIKRAKELDARDAADRERYQTVYAQATGSVAAPTAGLHFTHDLLGSLDAHGIRRTSVTLHVGMGTFKPLSAERLEDHQMHAERYSIDAAAADAINLARREGRRVIAVGTTSARVLESQAADVPVAPVSAETRIFIYPPYQWRRVDALITNFHLPRSTLVALVAAFVGLERQRALYAAAIQQRYRFFSYGDAMLLE